MSVHAGENASWHNCVRVRGESGSRDFFIWVELKDIKNGYQTPFAHVMGEEDSR